MVVGPACATTSAMTDSLNERLQPLWGRRSVRKYSEQEVADPLILDLLRAAMAAPSACAKDPWRWVVIHHRRTLEAIAAVLPHGKMLAQAPVGIVVCGDLKAAHANELSYLLQDCSAAIENLLIAAHLLGLGACWLGVHPRPERVKGITGILGLPEHVLPVSGVAIGYPAETHRPRTRFKPEYVHQERWQG